jgi:hypothetical protein
LSKGENKLTDETKIVESAEEAGISGFQAVKKVRGLLTKLEVKDSKFKDAKTGNIPQQIEVTLNDAEILEKFPNAIGEVELKDDKFVTWIKYSKQKGAPPHGSSPYMRVWVASAKKLYGKSPTELVGTVVVLEQMEQSFKDENDKPIKFKFWGFSTAEGEAPINDYIKGLVVGLNQQAALRTLMMDARAKQHPEFATAQQNGELAEKLGLVVVDEVYNLPG